MKKICPVCQKEFEQTSHRQLYCSVQCRKINKIAVSKKWKYCNHRDCLYFCDTKDYNRCDFNWLTGELRDCGRGAECTKYKHATPSERRKYRNLKLKGNEDGDGRPLY